MNSLSNSDPKENICIYTYNQTAGRGQIGRYWYNGSDKNLAISWRIPLQEFRAQDQFLINIAFTLAVFDFISLYISSGITIKWPNDIYVHDKKIAGLLIQNSIRSDKISSSILGVGVNVNEADFPSELPNPISLHQLTKQSYNLAGLALNLSKSVLKRLEELNAEQGQHRDYYLDKLLRRDTLAKYQIGEEILEGIIRGITPSGKLKLEVGNQLKELNFREIKYL